MSGEGRYGPPVTRLLFVILASVIGAEAAVMLFVLPALPGMPLLVESLVDASLLGLAAFPFVYYFSYRPMRGAVERAREGEERYHHLFDSLTNPTVLVDAESGDILEVNDRCVEVLGRSRGELEEMSLLELHPEGERERYRGLLRDVGEGIESFEGEVVRGDGSRMPVQVTGSRATVGGREIVIGLFHDISEQKEREETLTGLHDATRDMLEAGSEEEVARVAVGAVEEVLGLPLAGVFLFDEESGCLEPAAATEMSMELFEEQPVFCEEGGSLAWGVFQSGEPRIFEEVGEEPDVYNPDTELEAEIIYPIGRHGVIDVASLKEGEFDKEGLRLVGLLATNTSSALDRLERERAERRVKDELEVLNRVIRHDIRTDVNISLAYIQEVIGLFEGEEREVLEAIRDSNRHILNLTENARDYVDLLTEEESGRGLEVVDLRRELESEVRRVSETSGGVEMVTGDLPEVEVVASPLLSAVFRNLLTNAVIHTDVDDLRVEVDVEELDGEVEVSIADNGEGIPDSHKEEIFGRGEKGLDSPGTGMGLYLSRRIVEDSRGEIWVEDNEPQGAVFRIRLKRAG